MNTPRVGHSTFYADGVLTVVGGHTTGFKPTATAEYYKDGKWHQLPTVYAHDNGFAVVMRSGEVLIGGGHTEELGVGQSFTLERYTPTTHSFEGFGCLDRRRVLANATQLANGCVIISGNHYAADAIGCYGDHSQVEHVKTVRQGRCNPYILPIANDDALIFSNNDVYNQLPDTVWVDRLKGDAYSVPLFTQWRPIFTDQPFNSKASTTSDNTYLLAAVNADGQLGLVVVNDTVFSLLPTTCTIPMKSPFGPIFYKGPVVVDRKRQQGYVIGVDSLCRRQYVLAIDYAKTPAALTLHYTDTLAAATVTIPVVTPDGNLLLAGGSPDNNYKPLATVWCYYFGTKPPATSAVSPLYLWGLVVCVAMAFLLLVLYLRRKNSLATSTVLQDPSIPTNAAADAQNLQLMEHICQLMEEEQLYLRSDLKVQDVAVHLGTNSSYVSECINNGRSQTFTQFVNAYRVHHAQKLLRQHPNIKTSIVAADSGFSTEVSFFRNFKAVTGMTPREWLQNSTKD